MKKQILLLFVTVISVTGWSQTNATFGVKAGLSSASMRGDAVDNLNNLLDFADGMISTHNRTGFFAGGYATIPLSGQISFEPGLYYSQKGYELRGDLGLKGLEFLGANATSTLQADYIDIPVLLKASIGGLQLFAGPQFSYLTKANLKTSAGVLGFNVFNNTLDATKQFNRWDMAVTGGVGYQFEGGFNLSAAYDYGLSKVDANKNINSYNNAIKIGIGFRF
ncbi:MAG: PorT family protein [Gloeobacteraceae cyanobacterium ES-bin-316]|nr:PorT family protein [Ferruginibacter sp.]